MIEVNKKGILLEKTSLDFECFGVLNPAAIREGNTVHLFYRAVTKGNYSTIGYCELDGPETIVLRKNTPLIFPEFNYESHGIEDPRICKIDGLYYLSYTAYDGVNALGALATSTDLKHFTKHGIVVPHLSYFEFDQLTHEAEDVPDRYWTHFNPNPFTMEINRENLIWDKNVIFFPRRIDGKLHFIHRIKPDIQHVAVNELTELTPEFWTDYISNIEKHTLLTPKFEHEITYIGGGAPPIETEMGWLLIYHGVRYTANGNLYSACAALLDLEDPLKEIIRLPYPLLQPEYDWEQVGQVNNVCFPCGTVVFDDTLYIYYGAADEQIAYATLSISQLLLEFKELINKNSNENDL